MTTAALTPSTVPYYTTENPRYMNFLQRVLNVAKKCFLWSIMVLQCNYCDFYIQKHLPGEPRSLDLLANLNGVLINSHNILDSPRLLPDTFINVGGLQIKKKLDTLTGVMMMQTIKKSLYIVNHDFIYLGRQNIH
jgi:predicted nucleic-acid-binding Zn-ribbon protein